MANETTTPQKRTELIENLKAQKSIIAELTMDGQIKELRAKKAFDLIDLAIEELEKN